MTICVVNVIHSFVWDMFHEGREADTEPIYLFICSFVAVFFFCLLRMRLRLFVVFGFVFCFL